MPVIDVFDVIGDYWGEGVSAKSVARAIAANDTEEPITVRVNSPGGDVWEGHAIYNLLRGAGVPVQVEIHGLAASMASIVALAGDTVHMAENAMLMVHNPSAVVAGDASDMADAAALLDKVKSTLVGVYQRRTGKTAAQVSQMMDAETWLTASEAQAEGFVDKVVGSFGDSTQPTNATGHRFAAVLAKFEHVPRRFAAILQRENDAMDRAQLLALFGLSADASDDEIRSKALALQNPPSLRDSVPRADLDAANVRVTELTAQVAAFKREKVDAFRTEARAAVDNAVAAGKIPPASAEYHFTNASRDADALRDFKAYVGTAPTALDDSQMKRAEERHAMDGSGSSALTDSERAICARLGVSEEDYAKEREAAKKSPSSHMYGSHVG